MPRHLSVPDLLARLARAAVLATLLLAAAGPRIAVAAAADAFVTGTEDLPLMPGLAPVHGAGVVFDSARGRIVEAFARGAVKRADVLAFYRATLPQLGWTGIGETEYRREGEVLRLELYDEKDGLTVRFYLAPS